MQNVSGAMTQSERKHTGFYQKECKRNVYMCLNIYQLMKITEILRSN